jgi:hypothetical protein
MLKVSIGWVALDQGGMALVFEPAAWRLCQLTAMARQTTAEEMIADAVVMAIAESPRIH